MAHILIIDDERPIRKMIRKKLERVGHTAFEAQDGEIGIQLLGDNPVAVVITDLHMPKMDGFEIIKRLKEEFPQIKIIAISGGSGKNNHEEPLIRAKLLGADKTLAKPFDMNRLVSDIASLLSE